MATQPIVVGFDDSPAARAARGWAMEHAQRTESELLVVYVESTVAEWELAAVQINPDPIRHEFKRRLHEEWTEPVRVARIRYRTMLGLGRVADELMRIARAEDASLLVIGMTYHGTLGELVFGSTQHELSRHAVRPVVAVPASWNPHT